MTWFRLYFMSMCVAALGLAINASGRAGALAHDDDGSVLTLWKVFLSPWGVYESFAKARSMETAILVALCGGFVLFEFMRKALAPSPASFRDGE